MASLLHVWAEAAWRFSVLPWSAVKQPDPAQELLVSFVPTSSAILAVPMLEDCENLRNRQHPPLGVIVADAGIADDQGKRASYLPVRLSRHSQSHGKGHSLDDRAKLEHAARHHVGLFLAELFVFLVGVEIRQ